MAEIPLTTHERGLIGQIHGEIDQLNREANECLEEFDKATTPEQQELWLRKLIAKNKAISERSQVRESIIRPAVDRLKPKE